MKSISEKSPILNLLSFAQRHCKSKSCPCSCLWLAQKGIFLKFYKDWFCSCKIIRFPLSCNGQNWIFHPFLNWYLLYAMTIIVSWYFCHSCAVLALKIRPKARCEWRWMQIFGTFFLSQHLVYLSMSFWPLKWSF